VVKNILVEGNTQQDKRKNYSKLVGENNKRILIADFDE
jgi:hypothetical protein